MFSFITNNLSSARLFAPRPALRFVHLSAAKLCLVEFTGSHDFSWVKDTDTLPFNEMKDPNWSVDPVTFERQRITMGIITMVGEKREGEAERRTGGAKCRLYTE